jgi:hypothetical protein
MVVKVVKIESRSFSSAEIQHLRTEIRGVIVTIEYIMIYMRFTCINYSKLAVEKDRDSIFTTIMTIWKTGLTGYKPPDKGPSLETWKFSLYFSGGKDRSFVLIAIRNT